jgi:hypothetical protein
MHTDSCTEKTLHADILQLYIRTFGVGQSGSGNRAANSAFKVFKTQYFK